MLKNAAMTLILLLLHQNVHFFCCCNCNRLPSHLSFVCMFAFLEYQLLCLGTMLQVTFPGRCTTQRFSHFASLACFTLFCCSVPVTHFHKLFTWFACTEIWHFCLVTSVLLLLLQFSLGAKLQKRQHKHSEKLLSASAILPEQLSQLSLSEPRTGVIGRSFVQVFLNTGWEAIVFCRRCCCCQIGYWHHCHYYLILCAERAHTHTPQCNHHFLPFCCSYFLDVNSSVSSSSSSCNSCWLHQQQSNSVWFTALLAPWSTTLIVFLLDNNRFFKCWKVRLKSAG